MPWSSRSRHAPISVCLSFHHLARSHGPRNVFDDLPFDGHRENLSGKFSADVNLSMHFSSRGPLPQYKLRLSLLYVVRMAIIFSPRPCSVYNFIEVFSVSNLFFGKFLRIPGVIILSLLTGFDGED
jgi:hypothetical protein